jgi:hypothetical protein
MNLNIIGISAISIIFLFLGYFVWDSSSPTLIPSVPGFLVAVDTRKTSHYIQSKTGDASMKTELTRRRAIQAAGRLDYSKIKETRTSSGSTNGVLETFFLTSICPKLKCISSCITGHIDGGDPTSLSNQFIDGGDPFSNPFCFIDGGTLSNTCITGHIDGGDSTSLSNQFIDGGDPFSNPFCFIDGRNP